MSRRFESNDDFPEDLFPTDYNGNEGEYDEEDFDDEFDGDPERLERAQAFDLERRFLNQKILFGTIKSLQKSWSWFFRSEQEKRMMIRQAYIQNLQLVTHGLYPFPDHTKDN